MKCYLFFVVVLSGRVGLISTLHSVWITFLWSTLKDLLKQWKLFSTLEISTTPSSICRHCHWRATEGTCSVPQFRKNQQIWFFTPSAVWHTKLSKRNGQQQTLHSCAQPWQGRVVYSSRNLWGYLGFLGLKSLMSERWCEIRNSFQYSRFTLYNSTRKEMLFVFQMGENFTSYILHT